jgi:hypothetical protein
MSSLIEKSQLSVSVGDISIPDTKLLCDDNDCTLLVKVPNPDQYSMEELLRNLPEQPDMVKLLVGVKSSYTSDSLKNPIKIIEKQYEAYILDSIQFATFKSGVSYTHIENAFNNTNSLTLIRWKNYSEFEEKVNNLMKLKRSRIIYINEFDIIPAFAPKDHPIHNMDRAIAEQIQEIYNNFPPHSMFSCNIYTYEITFLWCMNGYKGGADLLNIGLNIMRRLNERKQIHQASTTNYAYLESVDGATGFYDKQGHCG